MGPEGVAHHPLQGADVVAHQGHLADGREVEVERLEQVTEGLRVTGGQLVEQPQHRHRSLLVAVLPGERRQPQQAVGGGGVGGGDGVILEVLATGHELLVVR